MLTQMLEKVAEFFIENKNFLNQFQRTSFNF